jgi:hypothetical protein
LRGCAANWNYSVAKVAGRMEQVDANIEAMLE